MALVAYVAVGSSAIAAAIAGFLAYFVRKNQHRDRKVLVYDVEETALVPEGARFRGLIVTAGGESLESSTFYTVTCVNPGPLGLRADAIERPLTVKFADGQIIKAEVGFLAKSDSEFDPYENIEVGKNGRDVQAPTTLLNSGNAIVFYLVATDNSSPPTVSLHAHDFELVRKYDEASAEDRTRLFLRLGFVSSVVALFAIVLAVLSAV